MFVEFKVLEILLYFVQGLPFVDLGIQFPQEHKRNLNNTLRQNQQILHSIRINLLKEPLLQKMTVKNHQFRQLNQRFILQQLDRLILIAFVHLVIDDTFVPIIVMFYPFEMFP